MYVVYVYITVRQYQSFDSTLIFNLMAPHFFPSSYPSPHAFFPTSPRPPLFPISPPPLSPLPPSPYPSPHAFFPTSPRPPLFPISPPPCLPSPPLPPPPPLPYPSSPLLPSSPLRWWSSTPVLTLSIWILLITLCPRTSHQPRSVHTLYIHVQVTTFGVLCCFALFVDLACFFLPSFSPLIKACTCIHVSTAVHVHAAHCTKV